MKMSKAYIIPCITLVIGLGIGCIVAFKLRPSTASISSHIPSSPEAASSSNKVAINSQPAVGKSDSESKQQRRLDFNGMSVAEILSALSGLRGNSNAESEMRRELFRSWARKDPTGAWAAAAKLESAAERIAALGAVASALCATDPQAALKLIAGITAIGERSAVMKLAISEWAGSQPSAMLAYLKSHPTLIGDAALFSAVLGAAGGRDPFLTSQFLVGVPKGAMGYYDMDQSMNQWVTLNPTAARAWLDTLEDPDQRDRALKAFLSSTALKNPASYYALLEGIGDRDERLSARTNLLTNLLRTDVNAALDILKTLPVSELGSSFKYRLGHVLAEMSPQEQNAFLQKLPDGIRELAMGRVAENATGTAQYAQAVAALNQMPEGSERDRAMFKLSMRMSKENAKVAGDWINQQPDSSDRDLLTAGYANTLAATDVNSALTVASGIPDESVRRTALRNVVTQWLASDSNAAKAWLGSTNLLRKPDKDAILRMVGIGRPITVYPVVVRRR